MQISRADLLGNPFTFEPFLDHKEALKAFFQQKIAPIYGDQSHVLEEFEKGAIHCEAVVRRKKVYGVIAYQAQQSGKLFTINSLFLRKKRYYKKDYPLHLLQRIAELTYGHSSVKISATDKRFAKLLKDKGFLEEKNSLKQRVFCSSSKNLQKQFAQDIEEKLDQQRDTKERAVQEWERVSEKGSTQVLLGKRASSTRQQEEVETKKKRHLETSLTLASPALSRFQRQTSQRRELTLKKNYIHLIRNRLKTVEGRIATTVRNYREGDTIRFFYDYDPKDDVVCLITKIENFVSFKEMLQSCGFKKCIPNVVTFEQAVRAYDAIPSYAERARKSGVAALHLQVIQK